MSRKLCGRDGWMQRPMEKEKKWPREELMHT
jgi:hypothetical protein